MSVELILVRHAAPKIDRETPAPKWPLSDEGRVAAAALAERLVRSLPEAFVLGPDGLTERIA